MLLALIGGRIALGLSAHPSDDKQIQDELQRSIEASREGRPGGVMDMLSSQLSYNGQDASGNLGQVAQFIKKQRPDITVEKPDPIITGDEAHIVSPVDISVSFLGQQKSFHLKNVTLAFQRESTRKYLFFPSTTWRLTNVRADTPSDLDISQ